MPVDMQEVAAWEEKVEAYESKVVAKARAAGKFPILDYRDYPKELRDIPAEVRKKMAERRRLDYVERLTRQVAELTAKIKSAEESLVPMLERKAVEAPTADDTAAAIRHLKRVHGPRKFDKLPQADREAMVAKQVAEKKAGGIAQQNDRAEGLRAELAAVKLEMSYPLPSRSY